MRAFVSTGQLGAPSSEYQVFDQPQGTDKKEKRRAIQISAPQPAVVAPPPPHYLG